MKTTHFRRVRRGQAIVEMALVVTILLVLALGVVQFGLIAQTRVVMTNVAREGARYSGINALVQTDTQLKNYIDSYIANGTAISSITTSNITIATPQGRLAGKEISVTINYDMRQKFIVPANFANMGLSGFGTSTSVTSTMIIE